MNSLMSFQFKGCAWVLASGSFSAHLLQSQPDGFAGTGIEEMRGRMYARDRRDIALYRRRLLAGLHLGTDKFSNSVRLRRQKGLAHGFAIRLEYRPIGLLRAQRIGRVSALRHRLPFEQVRQRAVKHRLRGDRHGPEFRAPLGHFHLIHRFSKETKSLLVMITVIIKRILSDYLNDRSRVVLNAILFRLRCQPLNRVTDDLSEVR